VARDTHYFYSALPWFLWPWQSHKTQGRPGVHGQCSNALIMASRKRLSTAEILKQLDLSDVELFEDTEDEDRDCDRGPGDVEPTSDADSEATEGYDVPAEDDVPAAEAEEDGHVSGDLHFASGIVHAGMLTACKKSPCTKCVVCNKHGRRKETRYICVTCLAKPALCVVPCFQEFHSTADF